MDLHSPPSITPLLPTSLLLLLLLTTTSNPCSAQSTLCRNSCGSVPIRYPFGIDDGCGSPYYRNLLSCSPSSVLHLRTPSGSYPVTAISYTDPHIVVSDPSMWSCRATHLGPVTPFSLDTSTHFSLSPKNDFLFFNCSGDSVIVAPRPSVCDRFPDRCDSACDSAGYLCRNLPGCPEAVGAGGRSSCCSYHPAASESLRLMLRHCAAYTSVYWRAVGASLPPYDQVPEYGIRVEFQIPVTTRCLRCQDPERGAGACGFDTGSLGFLCLCEGGNVTGYCSDGGGASKHGASVGVVAGTTTVASVAGIAGVGALVLYLRRLRTNKVVTCGVQSSENRLF